MANGFRFVGRQTNAFHFKGHFLMLSIKNLDAELTKLRSQFDLISKDAEFTLICSLAEEALVAKQRYEGIYLIDLYERAQARPCDLVQAVQGRLGASVVSRCPGVDEIAIPGRHTCSRRCN